MKILPIKEITIETRKHFPCKVRMELYSQTSGDECVLREELSRVDNDNQLKELFDRVVSSKEIPGSDCPKRRDIYSLNVTIVQGEKRVSSAKYFVCC
jgi:hypothetical protein